MENEEAQFKILFAKYLGWKESQQSQQDGSIYEKSFVEFAQEFNTALFALSLQEKADCESAKKSPNQFRTHASYEPSLFSS